MLLAACGDCRFAFGDALARCGYERVLAAPDAGTARALALAVEDPVVRGAAVMGWVESHRGGARPQDGQALCAVLESPREEQACERRLLAAHLQR